MERLRTTTAKLPRRLRLRQGAISASPHAYHAAASLDPPSHLMVSPPTAPPGGLWVASCCPTPWPLKWWWVLGYLTALFPVVWWWVLGLGFRFCTRTPWCGWWVV